MLGRSGGSVLVVGESLVDVTRDGADTSVRPGGSPLNVAVGLSRLGVPTTLLTQLGDDAYGELVRAHLAASGVNVALLGPPGRTGSATVRLDAAGQASYSFDVRWDPPPDPLPDGYDQLHVGSLGATLPPGADVVAALVRQARERGMGISLDPNIRPAMTPELGEVRRRVHELVALADVVKLSEEDAGAVFPRRTADQVLDDLLAAGAPVLVVLTRGDAGAMLASPTARVSVAAAAAPVVDTIGAGDSFMAALLAGLRPLGRPAPPLDRGELEALGRFACQAAAITCSRAGADPPWRATLSALAPSAPSERATYTRK